LSFNLCIYRNFDSNFHSWFVLLTFRKLGNTHSFWRFSYRIHNHHHTPAPCLGTLNSSDKESIPHNYFRNRNRPWVYLLIFVVGNEHMIVHSSHHSHNRDLDGVAWVGRRVHGRSHSLQFVELEVVELDGHCPIVLVVRVLVVVALVELVVVEPALGLAVWV
jgi:hypothetical protein